MKGGVQPAGLVDSIKGIARLIPKEQTRRSRVSRQLSLANASFWIAVRGDLPAWLGLPRQVVTARGHRLDLRFQFLFDTLGMGWNDQSTLSLP